MYNIKTKLNEEEIAKCIRKCLKCEVLGNGLTDLGREYFIRRGNVEEGHLSIKKIDNELHEIYFLDISQKDVNLIEQEINSKEKGE